MSIPENIANSLGRIKGTFQKGIADAWGGSWSDPLPSNQYAWTTTPTWGEGMSNGKPATKTDYIRHFTEWVYIATSLKATAVAQVPLRLYVAKQTKTQKFKGLTTRALTQPAAKEIKARAGLRRFITKAEEVEEISEHPLIGLLEEVNGYHTRFDLWYLTSLFLDLTGECYWFLPQNSLGIPSEIWVIPSHLINPKMGDSLADPIAYYEYQSGGQKVPIDPDEIIMHRSPDPNNIFRGFGVMKGIANAVWINSQMNTFEEALFRNKARAGGVFETTEKMSRDAKDRFEGSVEEKYKGARAAGKSMVLPFGIKYHKDSMTPEELSFIEGRRKLAREICAAFGVPYSLFTEEANRADSRSKEAVLAQYGIKPRVIQIEEKLNEALCPKFDDRIFVAFDNPVPQDRELLFKEQGEYVKNTIRTINEARETIGDEPIDGGDTLLMSANMIPLESYSAAAQPESNDRAGFIESVKAEMKRLLAGEK